jgi:7-cyano-7-deazaguanine synthase
MKIVVILSGGMDSVTLLYHLASIGHQVAALSVNYGQKHSRELEFAKMHAEKLGIDFQLADLTGITHLLQGSALTDSSIAVPEGHYEDETMKATVVPNRNMIMLSVAIGYAISIEADAVAYGAHAGDHAVYPDCRPEFADAMERVAALADWRKVELLRPFVGITKDRIADHSAKLGIDLATTWSCYKGGYAHCGKCGTCVERKEAIELAGLIDPTIYEAEVP